MKAKVIAAAAALAAAGLAVAGCGGAKPATASRSTSTAGQSTYLCPGSRTGELLKWRDEDGKLSGTFKDIWMDGHAPTEGITTISSGLSGTLNGTAITLNIGFPHLLHARLDGGHFSLNIPQPNGKAETVTCRPASMADWNKKVAALYDKLNEENNRPVSLPST